MTNKDADIRIDVWSDYVCPFCYLEVPVLARLQQDFGPALATSWHAFELRPDPVPTLDPNGDYLHDAWERSVYPMAARRRMPLRLPPLQPRSRKALEAAAYARAAGRFDPMHQAIFRAFFEDGRDIGQPQVLSDLALEAGLDPAALTTALEQGRYTEPVLHDQRLAHELGISAVPTMLVRRADAPWRDALPLSGALPYEQVQAAVTKLKSEG